MLTTIVFYRHVFADPMKPRFGWGSELYRNKIDPDLLLIGSVLKDRASDTDVFVVIPPEPDNGFNDVSSKIISFSGLSSYLARAGIPSERSAVARACRLDNISRGIENRDGGNVLRYFGGLGVDWLVIRDETLIKKLSARVTPSFLTTRSAVFATRAVNGLESRPQSATYVDRCR
jgi:hypothetical protein